MNGTVPVDLTADPEYSGRVQYSPANNLCTLRLTDLRESDSAEYMFMFITNQPDGRFIGSPGVTLSVSEPYLEMRVIRHLHYATYLEDYIWEELKLKCLSSCRLPDNPSFIFYKNGQKLSEATHSEEIHAADSYSCTLEGYEAFPSPSVCINDESCNRVTYTDRSVCAVRGSSVNISCTYNNNETITSKFWFRPEGRDQRKNPEDLREDSQYAGRVQIIETERGRSTLRIADLRESDSAAYHFKFKTQSFEWRSSLPGTNLTVTALQVQVTRITVQQSHTYAELKCHSSCSQAGHPSYVWFKNGEEMMGVETSSIKAQLYPADNISCAVKGHQEFPSPAVYAPKLPSVSVNPSAEIEEGSSVTLTCSSDANPAAYYTWYKENGNPDVISLSEEPQLVFSSIQSSDSGQYYCAAENELGRRASSHITINVKYAPKLPSVSVNPSAEIEEGSSVTLTCSSDANPAAKYTWYKEDGNPGVISLSEEPQLVFSSIQSSDSGQYYCAAENELGRRASSHITINVKYAPKLPSVSVNPSAEIEEGSSVTLTCSSDANPAAKYTWYKEDGNPGVISLSEEPQLVFSSIQSSDSGQYYCAAENELGRRASSHITINVKYAPKLPSVSVNPSAEIEEGSSVTLTCSSDANPAAYYTWYKENGNPGVISLSEEPQLVFSSIQSSDSGQYYCAAENELGRRASSHITINVKYAPKLPSVSVNPSAEIEEGSSVTLTCSSDANPAAKYTWYKEDEDSPKASGQIFTITDVRPEHNGNYYCEAENTRGRHFSTLQLMVVADKSMMTMNILRLTLVVVMPTLLVLYSLWMRRQKTLSSTEPNEAIETVELESDPDYVNVSAVDTVSAGQRRYRGAARLGVKVM
ncbi:hypothetical protein ABVT39_004453 [Epinephelus coioides]